MRASVLFVAAVLAAVASAAEPLRVRVLSYNIHHGEGVDRKLDLERIAKVITSVRPDLVALQEVDRETQRTGQVDQPAKFAELTEMQVVFGSNLALQGGGYGNAVLVKKPFAIKRHENHKLPQLGPGEPRGLLETEIELPDGRGTVLFFNTHFDHRPEEGERVASAEFVQKRMKDVGDRPALLLGDLNATADSKPLKTLLARWTSANATPLPTIPVDKPRQQIDFVLFTPAQRWKVIDVRVLDEAIASDHRAIFAELELTGE